MKPVTLIMICFFGIFILTILSVSLPTDLSASTPKSKPKITIPGPGSKFVYQVDKLDAANDPILAKRDTFDVSVLDTGLSYMGRSNVVMLWGIFDTFYVAYDSEGTFELFGPSKKQYWYSYPQTNVTLDKANSDGAVIGDHPNSWWFTPEIGFIVRFFESKDDEGQKVKAVGRLIEHDLR